jgi:citrate lyase subunit beta / citryl-CoA lyase
VGKTAPRSALYVPANAASLLDMALAARPDAIIVDLEDAIANPDEKPNARVNLADFTARVRSADITAVIRVNGVDTPWFNGDVTAAIAQSPDAILLPMADLAGLAALSQLLKSSDPRPRVWALIERMVEVADIETIASCGFVDLLTIGYGDLCKELELATGADHPQFDVVRLNIVAAAHRNHLEVLDGVHIGPNSAGADACARSRLAGFDGRTLYSAGHVAGCHQAFEECPPGLFRVGSDSANSVTLNT